jgi:hypothetical protein
MPIPESQLETWSHQGATVTAKRTHESIRAALQADTSPLRDRISSGAVNLYLQGSYKNDTNIRGDSDVDLVVEGTDAFYSNLTEAEKHALGLSSATYTWAQLRADVVKALQAYYGNAAVEASGNKSVKVLPDSGRIGADVVPCFEHRNYQNLRIASTGITFWTQRDNRQIINYPKLHYDNGCAKNSATLTNGWYKPSVRLFKNARTYLVDKGTVPPDLAPSYFLESLIYNATDADFGTSYRDTFCAVLYRLWKKPMNEFIFQNGQHSLFGTSDTQWNSDSATRFLQALIDLWNNW